MRKGVIAKSMRQLAMQASAWNSGGNTYGIRVGVANRAKYFDPKWKMIEVELDERMCRFELTPGFWKKCPEFRDHGQPLLRGGYSVTSP
jgi:hypothetical protein